MVEPADIVNLARKFSFANLVCGDDQDLLRATGMDGDDATEFFDAFAREYSVDMSEFVSIFHYDVDEPPYYRRVRAVGRDGRAFGLIPVTPKLMADAANEGRWPLEYPIHRVRISHWPIAMMFVFLASFVLAVTLLLA